MGNVEHWTLYVCPACGAGPFDRDPAEEHAAEDCDPDTWPWEAIEVVPASHLRGAVEALWRIADHSLPPEHDDLQEYAVAVLQAFGVDLATYRPGGQYEAAPPNKRKDADA